MPLKVIDVNDWLKGRNRVLIMGPPNSGKSYSLMSMPRPVHVLSCPGEKGWATIKPDPDNGIHLYAFVEEPGPKKSGETVREVKQLIYDLMSNKKGPVASLAVDGLHKFYEYLIDVAAGGAYFTGDDFEAFAYGVAQREVAAFLTLLSTSDIENVAITTWDGLEKDKAGQSADKTVLRNSPSHVWPDLPGKAAKRIVGEFTATVYATARAGRMTAQGATKERVWQLLPDDEVWGIGLKVPRGVVVPKYIPQAWDSLMAVLDGGAK